MEQNRNPETNLCIYVELILNNIIKNTHWGRSSSLINGAEETGYPCAED
jgi:hypothetical protein